MSLLQHCFTVDTKFLTSFLTIAISIVTWCPPYIFFSFLILAPHCLFFLLLIGSSSKGIRRTSIESETFIFLNVMKPKFLFLIVLIEPFARKFGHHILLGRIQPKDAKNALSVDARLTQNAFAQAHY